MIKQIINFALQGSIFVFFDALCQALSEIAHERKNTVIQELADEIWTVFLKHYGKL